MRLLLASVTIGLLAVLPAKAAVIDFDGIPVPVDGTDIPLTSFTEDGFSFNLTFSPLGQSEGPTVFDTNCALPCNGDADLRPLSGNGDVSGNVLILQSDQDPEIPNDDPTADNSITLEVTALPTGVTSFSFDEASAVDDGVFGFSVDADGAGGMAPVFLDSISLTDDSETGKAFFASGDLGIGSLIIITYSSSGGVDSLVLTENDPGPTPAIPLPAPIMLLGSALAGLVITKRRKLV